MTRYLALDLGRKHTGVASAESSLRVPIPLQTIHHEDEEELLAAVTALIEVRKVDTLILGLPLLPGGAEGEQAAFMRGIEERLRQACPRCSLHVLDERWTSKGERGGEEHARAAVRLLEVWLERQNEGDRG